MTLLLRDDFRGDRRAGSALGPARDGDPARGGVDVERLLSVDGGALRIMPPLHAGWGRTCLSYGPFANERGLAFSVQLLNGHNTSQSEVMADTLRSRVARWARGSGAVPVARRLRRWLVSGRVRRTLRQVRWWRQIATGSTRVNLLDENLAVGFYPAAVGDPTRAGAGFVMHADGPRNGELWAGADGKWAPVVLGVQNVPITYVAIVREYDVLLGAASLPGAHGLGAHPCLRPLAVVARPDAPRVHAGVHQAVLGQIGFRADTRVHGARVARLEARDLERLLPLAADQGLAGAVLAGRAAAVGGTWHQAGDLALLDAGRPVGLTVISCDPGRLGAGAVVVRGGAAADGSAGWELRLAADGAALATWPPGGDGEVAACSWSDCPGRVQVLDDGRELAVLAPGGLLFGRRFRSPGDGPGTALAAMALAGRAPAGLLGVEAMARELDLPDELLAGEPWNPESGAEVAADPLEGPPGDLDGRALPGGGVAWRRLRGSGVLESDGAGGARWHADPSRPLPDRTIYAIDWPDPGFADLEVTLTPPGTARGQRQHGTAGFCLWQDEDHHLLVNTWLDDGYGGASLSSFFTIGGFEDLYDAIWTNVGDRVTWGRPLRLRLVSDGLRYTVSLDGEPVLHRSLADVYPGCRPLRITQVGLLGNWEWGADTGSRFSGFRAAARQGRR